MCCLGPGTIGRPTAAGLGKTAAEACATGLPNIIAQSGPKPSVDANLYGRCRGRELSGLFLRWARALTGTALFGHDLR